MSDTLEDEPLILKKKKKIPPGHHGGAWKIAYADFVTAMMAFFLLLWLLNATSEEVREGISNFFQPTLRTTPSTSGAGGIFGGITVNDPGPMEVDDPIALQDSAVQAQTVLDTGQEASGREQEASTGDQGHVDAQAEEQNFMRLKQLLERSIDELPPELAFLQETIRVDVTEDGLRIQLVDHEGRSSFIVNTTRLTPEARDALRMIGTFIERMPNRISIAGHTDASGEAIQAWDLSLRRANATRRALAGHGIPEQRFETVIGKGATEPAVPADANAAENRRMEVILLRMARPRGLLDAGGPQPPSITRPEGG